MCWRIFRHVLRFLVMIVLLSISTVMIFDPITNGSIVEKWCSVVFIWIGYAALLWFLYVVKKVHHIA
jgi:hypothetical protein